MTDSPKYFIVRARSRVPFRHGPLPLITGLARMGFHQYKNRWAKRLGKRIGRLAFDTAYRLGLGGCGAVDLMKPDGPARLTFDARKHHYASLYLNHYRDGYEPEVAALLETFLTDARVFYDVGSNWGYFAFYAATKPGYEGFIHAFEPVPKTFADLMDWVIQADLAARINCHRLALSDESGTGVMAVDSETSGLARLVEGNTRDGGEAVTLARVDDLDLPQPDVLKIDVEDHELNVLRGARSVLATRKPMLIFENWLVPQDRDSTLAPLRLLKEAGYFLFQPLWRLADGRFLWPKPHRPLPHGDRVLAMVPFASDDRFSMRDQVNVFACHRDRLNELGEVFDSA